MVGISTLWVRYPKTNYPCSTNNRKNFVNQCAIRLGVCLQNSGIDTDKLKVEKCWHHPAKEGHTLRARQLAKALSRGIVSGVGMREEYEKGVEGLTKIWGRTGSSISKIFGRSGRAAGRAITSIYGTNACARVSLWTKQPRINLVLPGNTRTDQSGFGPSCERAAYSPLDTHLRRTVHRIGCGGARGKSISGLPLEDTAWT
jgi:hypothetical protein